MNWFYQYFIEPIELGYGYNLINTIVYALAFIVFTYGAFEMLKRLKIKIDQRLALSITPFVILGSSIRVLEDAKILTGYMFVTPNIWVLFFFLIISILLISVFLERKKRIPYYKIMFILGIILTGLVLGMLEYKNFQGLKYVLLWILPWLVLLKYIKWSVENKIITSVHMLDAVTTFVSMKYFGYFEQHVLPRTVINLTGTAFSFVILKFLVVVSVLFILDKYSDDKEFKNFIKLAIFILGLAPGVRDFLRLVCLV